MADRGYPYICSRASTCSRSALALTLTLAVALTLALALALARTLPLTKRVLQVPGTRLGVDGNCEATSP